MKNLIDCPAERAVYFLGGKWKIRILFSLLQSKKIREISILPVRSKMLFIFLVLLLALIITYCVNHRKEVGC